MDSSLIAPFIMTALSGAGAYTHFHFKRYQASLDQARKVRRVIADVLTETGSLFRRNMPAPELKPDLSAMLQRLNQEAGKLDDMTICLPLKRLQREQRHVLRHAVWLLRYLDSHLADNEGNFFLLLHDVAMGCDYEVENIHTSLNTVKNHPGVAFQ